MGPEMGHVQLSKREGRAGGACFFSSRRRHTRYWRDWSQTCALPIFAPGAAQRESMVDGPTSESQTKQYSLAKILGIWAAAALPMGALAWVVAPLVAAQLDGPVPLSRALIVSLTIGLIWQFVMVMFLVYRERRSLRWSVLKDALWLHLPRSSKTGRVGGRLWLVLIPALLFFWVQDFIPSFPPPVTSHTFEAFALSDAGQAFMSGNWVWYAVLIALSLFNTVLGEELLFRGVLLLRMRSEEHTSELQSRQY